MPTGTAYLNSELKLVSEANELIVATTASKNIYRSQQTDPALSFSTKNNFYSTIWA